MSDATGGEEARPAAFSLSIDDSALHLVDLALEEDRGAGDWTTRWTVPARTRGHARIVAKADGVVAGTALAAAVFQRLDPRADCQIQVGDGGVVQAGAVVCVVRGPVRAILTGERVALNFLQRLSGIATLTRRYVAAVAGTAARIIDTRKTTPGWRALEKAAVRAGGGENHRMGLYDMVLIKENHASVANGVGEAIRRVQDQNTRALPVAVEIHSLDDLEIALEGGVDRVLFDNMSVEHVRLAMDRLRQQEPRPVVEVSGNMTPERAVVVAATGVDFISVGAITHSAPALDLSLRLEQP